MPKDVWKSYPKIGFEPTTVPSQYAGSLLLGGRVHFGARVYAQGCKTSAVERVP